MLVEVHKKAMTPDTSLGIPIRPTAVLAAICSLACGICLNKTALISLSSPPGATALTVISRFLMTLARLDAV